MFVFLLFYVLLENMMSTLLVKGCKKLSLSSTLWPLSRKGFLSCQTCYDTGPRFLRLHPKDRPNLAAFYKKQGIPMIHSNTHLHHKVECWILNHGHLNIYQMIKHPQKFLTFHLRSPPPSKKKKKRTLQNSDIENYIMHCCDFTFKHSSIFAGDRAAIPPSLLVAGIPAL